jgi:hypothetical protein
MRIVAKYGMLLESPSDAIVVPSPASVESTRAPALTS